MKKIFSFVAVAAFTLLATSCGDTAAVIGTSIRLGNLEVAQNDFPKLMNWNEAKEACEDLGGSWRLPTKEELHLLCANKEKIGGFAHDNYWSSSDDGYDHAWLLYFDNHAATDYFKNARCNVRAVSFLTGDAEAKRLADSVSEAKRLANFTDSVTIGTSIRFGNLEVAQNDFSKLMTWNEAKQACADLGAGWRLPTKEELNLLYENKAKIGGFSDYYYWSSTDYANSLAWIQYFYVGIQSSSYDKDSKCKVRGVRAF